MGKAVGGPDLAGKCDILDRLNGDVKEAPEYMSQEAKAKL